MKIPDAIRKNPVCRSLFMKLEYFRGMSRKISIDKEGHGWFTHYQTEKCEKNKIIIENGAYISRPKMLINGRNNRIIIHKDAIIGPDCIFQIDGNNITIEIGEKSSFTREVSFCAQEDNCRIDIGNECMFFRDIIIRTSDSHPIFDEAGNRINLPQSVIIGNHVWIASNCSIMKGAIIGNNSIVGSNSMVNKEIQANCLAVGTPAKAIRTDVYWTNDKLF